MSMVAEISPLVLSESEWRERRLLHETRVRTWTEAHQLRVSRGEKHPVYDFLFSYYAFRPAWLRRWHPGPDIVLTGEGAGDYLRWPEYQGFQAEREGVALDLRTLRPPRRAFVVWLRALLIAMRERPAFFGCFGLHEWAMVYRQTPEELRHNAYALRFPVEELARIVE